MQKVVSNKIPNKLYREIYRLMPIVCVDVIAIDRTGKHFFLAKRANKPEKEKWMFPGGRVYKNELLKHAARRKLKEETNLTGTIVRQLGIYEYRSSVKGGFFKGVNVHSPIVVFLMKVNANRKVKLDTQGSNYGWFEKIVPSWHPYVKEFLRKAGFQGTKR